MEPMIVCQTFEAEHVADKTTSRQWFQDQAVEAEKAGGGFIRCTYSDDRKGLLFECWESQPEDQGAPRWSLKEGTQP